MGVEASSTKRAEVEHGDGCLTEQKAEDLRAENWRRPRRDAAAAVAAGEERQLERHLNDRRSTCGRNHRKSSGACGFARAGEERTQDALADIVNAIVEAKQVSQRECAMSSSKSLHMSLSPIHTNRHTLNLRTVACKPSQSAVQPSIP